MYQSIEEYSKDMISIQEVCDLLHISKNAIYVRIKKKGFPKRISRGYFSRREILEWLEKENVRE